MPSIIQFGLVIEAILNIVGAIPFVLYPEWCLSFAVATNAETGTPTVPPSSALLWQVYGVLVLALTVPLILCTPDSKAASEKRHIIFTTLLAGEVFIEAILLWHISQPDKSGFTLTSLVLSSLFLLPALSWHAYVTYINPNLVNELSNKSVKKAI
ncbi:uncharacterized protein F4822DRAFT_384138 [Hypoxylon trugodes]|uniref:uncharacterized protein n=1 Tax=Hypoxylon trugodes TaxID=326681 RepID=UPI0021966B60|nr:uncharacterized protein F4822DRAFT_384138 [Hypoxylon trugodes]KAI1393273.1 hypothetical protein F4822DRAFT_384138 [Hypoxylon trugodes]